MFLINISISTCPGKMRLFSPGPWLYTPCSLSCVSWGLWPCRIAQSRLCSARRSSWDTHRHCMTLISRTIDTSATDPLMNNNQAALTLYDNLPGASSTLSVYSVWCNSCAHDRTVAAAILDWKLRRIMGASRAWPTYNCHSHITLQPKTGYPLKLSRVEPGQYLDGRPSGKTRLLLEEVLERPAGGAHPVFCVGPNAAVSWPGHYSCSVFCKVNYQLTFEYFKIYNVSLVFFIYVMVFIIVVLIICLFQEVHYVLTIIHI